MLHRSSRYLITLCIIAGLLFNAASSQAWAADKPSLLRLTPEEQEFVASHDHLKVGYVTDRIPVSFTGENGELDGISRYVFDRISQLCGIKFEYVPLSDGEVTYDYLLSEGFDLVTSVEYNKENQGARGILISDPYLSSYKVIVARKDLKFDYQAHLKVAIPTGSQTIRKFLARVFPNFEVVDYPSIPACFEALNAGEADLMIQNQYIAEYWFSKPSYEHLQVIPMLGMEDAICFSAVVTFGDYTEGPDPAEGEILIGLLNKAIAALTEDEVSNYTIQAVMQNQYQYTLTDFLYRYRFAVGIFTLSAVIILILLILLGRQRIRLMRDQADAKAKGQFLSTMSHEIRTPLNGLIGLNYLMSQKTDDPEQLANYLRQSNITANYLLSLVNDILDMSKLQDEKMRLIYQPVRLDLLLDTVQSIVGNAMLDKGLQYHVDSEFIEPCVSGDEVRIQQVILNLLDNARKFTPEGGSVSLTLRQAREHDRVRTTVTVADTGRGMTEEFQKRIFDAFAQELDTVSKGNQGTGLGLPISQKLAHLMDGDLTFVSHKGEGSTFTFTFLAQPAEMPAASADTPHRTGGTRILVAEDNELNAEIMLELLTEKGFEVDLAVNGEEAVERFAATAPDTYSAILMDLLMPVMDGFTAARAIRALDRPDAATVRIFACTANAFSEDRDKALESGMDDFIAKPIDIERLLELLEH